MEGLTGKRCEYHPFLPCPGFHISNLPFEIYQVLPFHIDSSILYYSRNVDLSHVRSILLLIEQPTEGAGLEYLNAHQIPTLYHYEYEKFHMWSGGLIHHRMTGLKCGEGEHRITLQCHLYYDPILDINIMYF